MKFKRSSGILLHPTSLPGEYGIGDLGPQAYRWIDFLSACGCSLWQVLPLGPTGYGDSPYQCFSAFAGNPYLVSPEALLAEKLLFPDDLIDRPSFPPGRVDFGALIPWKLALLERAFDRYQASPPPGLQAELTAFRSAHASWLEDFALFMTLKEIHGGAPWVTWEPELRDHQPEALAAVRQQLSAGIDRQVFRQFLFFRQWEKLRRYVHSKGIQIIGDIPIFVAHDSADVWANPDLFFLTKTGQPKVVAGVPPDYYSATGQLWGNPLYRWKYHKQTGFAWWIKRMQAVLQLVDIIRLDHFRGFAGYWQVPGNAKTAENGRWVKAPGKAFLAAVKAALGDLPLIAEDLGVITPDVEDLRDSFDLPGMKVVQFAWWSTPSDTFMPHNHVPNCVVYTGTHDNDTARGWYHRVSEEERSFYRRYQGRDGSDVAWDLIRTAWRSVGILALAPMQDFLDLGNEARMNYPGNPSGNWSWRMPDGALTEMLKNRIKEFNYLYDRK
ncbi:MAG: 4-alpha-glucanotransferase [Anaerolineales bacterium]|jgi:4-alpha-glucanotransferase|nr:4-alpha-glucanotransferase [Anaerolineales bacterium]